MKSFPNIYKKPSGSAGQGTVLGQSVSDTSSGTDAMIFGDVKMYTELYDNYDINATETLNDFGGESLKSTVNNPYYMGPDVYKTTNKYRGYFTSPIKTPITKEITQGAAYDETKAHTNNTTTTEPTVTTYYDEVMASPSLFNPYYAVRALGMTENIPLLDTTKNNKSFGNVNQMYDTDIHDCSIKHLVELSKRKKSILGNAKYKYSDFMYCRDVGKISNNHMITLRKFASPIGDNIYRAGSLNNDYGHAGDIGRLITWFGTEENKLENIMKYNFSASWREVNSKFELQDSKEVAESRGILGKLALFSDINNNPKGANAGLLDAGAMTLTGKSSDSASDPSLIGQHYDEHKVYEPLDTIRSTHLYEGNLTFNQEFTLVFNYKLRAYDNINPKSAMLDMLGNIMSVTYKKGSFWGGDQKIIGLQKSPLWSKIQTSYDMLDNVDITSADSVAVGIANVINNFIGKTEGQEGYIDSNELLASAKNAVVNNVKDITGGDSSNKDDEGRPSQTWGNYDVVGGGDDPFTGGPGGSTGAPGESNEKNKNIFDVANITAFLGNTWKNIVGKVPAIKPAAIADIKNWLGVPSRYSWQTLLTGDNVGLWHVTIGNPLNPIASIGNLIVTNTEVQHSGPLGFDDFPTELKVTVTLKHARPRDMVEIGKMYTKGLNALYIPIPTTNYMNMSSMDTDTGTDDEGYITNEAKSAQIINIDNTSESIESVGWIGDYVQSRVSSNIELVNRKFTPNTYPASK